MAAADDANERGAPSSLAGVFARATVTPEPSSVAARGSGPDAGGWRRPGVLVPAIIGVIAFVAASFLGVRLITDSRVAATVKPVPDPTRAAVTSVVATIPVGPLPQGVAIDEASGLLFVTRHADPDTVVDDDYQSTRGTLEIIDTATRAVVGSTLVGAKPLGVAVDSAGGVAWVANSGERSVTAVSLESREAASPIAVGAGPRYLAVEPDTGLVYISNTDEDSMVVLDGRSRYVIDWTGVFGRPLGVALEPGTGRVFVTSSETGAVEVIDPKAARSTFQVGERPFGVVVDDALGAVYATNWGANTVTVAEASTRRWWDTITVGNRPFGIALDSAARAIYVANWESNSVSVIDANTRRVVSTIPVGVRPSGVAVDPRDGTVYVVNSGDGTVSVLGT